MSFKLKNTRIGLPEPLRLLGGRVAFAEWWG